jgi:hypothetical protein
MDVNVNSPVYGAISPLTSQVVAGLDLLSVDSTLGPMKFDLWQRRVGSNPRRLESNYSAELCPIRADL